MGKSRIYRRRRLVVSVRPVVMSVHRVGMSVRRRVSMSASTHTADPNGWPNRRMNIETPLEVVAR